MLFDNVKNNAAYGLHNNPNPFSNTTIISYTLPDKFDKATLIVTDKGGKTLQQAALYGKGPGNYSLNAANLSAGTYQYSLLIDGKIANSSQFVIAK